jgi:type IV secretory pathway VirJ component
MRALRAIVLLTAVAALLATGGSVLRGVIRAPQLPPPAPVWTPVSEQRLSHGRIEDLRMFVPHGSPRGFVLLLSGADGWTPRMADLAHQLAQRGAMVAGIDLAQFDAKFEADAADCVFPDGDLENLSHFVQAYYRLPTYLNPILAGYAAGATFAYATLAQAPANTFAGAVSMDFCPSSPLGKRLCKGSGLTFSAHARDGGVDFLPSKQVGNPWVVLQGEESTLCGLSPSLNLNPNPSPNPGPSPGPSPSPGPGAVRDFVAQVPHAQFVAVPRAEAEAGAPPAWAPAYAQAFDALMAQSAPPATASASGPLGDLPLIAIAAQPGIAPSDTFAIMLSGDGGWAGLDKDVAAALSADGIEVVGLDSLRYFWTERTPDGLGADLERLIRYYLTALGKQRVMLIGYSQGADVLPFAVNRLTAATRSHVALTVVMGMSEHALFVFHLSSWLSDDNSGPATLPEIDKITGTPLLCIYGADEHDSLCPKLDPNKVTIVKLKGGHHFDGDYGGLARTILASAHR